MRSLLSTIKPLTRLWTATLMLLAVCGVGAGSSALAAPPTPTGLTATSGNFQVTLAWTASTGSTSYNIYRSTSPGAEGNTPIATRVTSTKYTNTGLTDGTPYFFKVAAVNSTGTSPQSSEAFAVPDPPQPPSVPMNVTASAGSTSITVKWSASTGVGPITYTVWRFSSAGGPPSIPGLSSTSYTDTAVTPNIPYTYEVSAQNSAGTSVQSIATTASVVKGTSEGPFDGFTAAIPGGMEAENYDIGGAGVAYHVTSVNGTANGYRTDGVDLEQTTDMAVNGGGHDVGWSAAGQWFRYTVNVAPAGTYTVTFRVANGLTTSGAFQLNNSSGTDLSGVVTVAPTGGWQTWTNVTASVTLPAGRQVLTWFEDTRGFNLNYMLFAKAASGG